MDFRSLWSLWSKKLITTGIYVKLRIYSAHIRTVHDRSKLEIDRCDILNIWTSNSNWNLNSVMKNNNKNRNTGLVQLWNKTGRKLVEELVGYIQIHILNEWENGFYVTGVTTNDNMGVFVISRAIFVRIMFASHGLICLWRLHTVTSDARYWLISFGLFGLIGETAVTLYFKRGHEWKW